MTLICAWAKCDVTFEYDPKQPRKKYCRREHQILAARKRWCDNHPDRDRAARGKGESRKSVALRVFRYMELHCPTALTKILKEINP